MPTNTFKVGEMLNKRSPFSKTWMNFDGSYTTEIYNSPVHFEDESGNLHNINTDLYDEADLDVIDEPVSREGAKRFREARKTATEAKNKRILNRDLYDFQGLKVPFESRLPRNFKKGYTIGNGGNKLTFKPIGASAAKGFQDTENRSVIQYQDAWNDADVTLELTPNGIKETIIVKTDRAPSKYTFEVDGQLEDDLTAGELKLEPAWLEDATGERRDVEQTVRREGNKTYVDLAADLAGLTYPVAIDPTVTIQPNETAAKDAYAINSGSTIDNSYLYVGNNSGSISKSYIQFNLSSIPAGAFVSDATIGLRVIDAYSTASQTIRIHRITSDWIESNGTVPTYDASAITTFNAADLQAVTTTSIATLVNGWLNNSYPNYGLMLMHSNEAASYTYKTFGSSSDTVLGYRPKLNVTYNMPPTAPTVTSPNGGETWNSSHAVTWTAATDPETAQASLRYHIQLSTNNGNTWKDIVALTIAGGTQYTYNFINEAETGTAKIRIRAYDGSAYGPWDESNGVFTIQHNAAPTAPTNLTPTGTTMDRAAVIPFTWKHNDPNGTDPQSKFDFDWRLQGSATWNTITQTTTTQGYDMPGNTLPVGAIDWRVRTYDQAGLSGTYSSVSVFTVANKPSNPTITAPTEGASVALANPVVQWSHPAQTEYHVKVLNAAGTTTIWEQKQASTNKAVTIGANLANQTSYKIQVAVKDAGGLWSDFETNDISVSYTPPATPILTAISEGNMPAINLKINNPVPSGTEPSVSINYLYRRKSGDERWTRIALDVSLNGSFIDYTPASGQAYEYYVRAWGENGTYRDSAVVNGSITLKSIWLMDPDDIESLHHFRYFEPGRTVERLVQGQMMEFEGRSLGMAEFSKREQNKVNVVLQLKEGSGDLEALHDLLSRQTTLLYRDSKGRLVYGVIFVLSANETDYGYSVPIEVQAVAYEEEV